MKRLLWLISIVLLGGLFHSCVDKIVVADSGPAGGKLILSSVPSGAKIYLAGNDVSKLTPDSLTLESGNYQITLMKENYRDTTFGVTVYDSLTTLKNIILRSLVSVGGLYLESEPAGAAIFLDSLKTNSVTPDTLLNLIAGEHNISLQKEDYLDTTFSVTIKEDQIAVEKITLSIIVPKGNIFLDSSPASAQIFVDSVNTNKITPDTLKNLTTGIHHITLKKASYIDSSFTVDVQKNETVSKKITLKAVVLKGNIFVRSIPAGAQIFADNINSGKITPDTIFNLTAGSHNILLKKSDFRDTAFSVTIPGNSTVTKEVNLTSNKGNLFIKSTPGGAQVFVDNINSGKITPDTIFNLTAGSHNILLKKSDYRDTTFSINIIGNSTVTKIILLTSSKGSIYLQSQPSGAAIYLNDVNTSKLTPDTLKNLTPGSYTVTLKYPEYNDTSFSVTVNQNKVSSKNITMTRVIYHGDLYIESKPSGAKIFIDNKNTNAVTPDTIKRLEVGDYDITLKLADYFDANFSVSIKRDVITEKSVTLQEKLPVDIDTLYYGIILFGQIRFTFSFNQDITLDKVDVIEPGSSQKTTFNFDNVAVQKDSQKNIYYPKLKTGDWTLIFYGNKTSVSKLGFSIQKTISVL